MLIALVAPTFELRQRVERCSNPFGDGHTGERVASLLADLPLDAPLLNKDLTL